MVAKKLGIPIHFNDLSDGYKKQVVDYMFVEYENGRTPNPDVLCNREIKFDLFLEETKKLETDYLATGHYVQKEVIQKNGIDVFRLLEGVDSNKDQSYFLCQLTQKQLEKSLFPLGRLVINDVRKIKDHISIEFKKPQ